MLIITMRCDAAVEEEERGGWPGRGGGTAHHGLGRRGQLDFLTSLKLEH